MTTLSRAATPVLIVDDNRDAADMLGAMLDATGYPVRIAYSGPEALSALQDFAAAIALLDIGLPDMDGYELARTVRERWPAIQLIAVTAYGQPSDREQAFQAGFAAHLVKPVSFADLRSTIDRLLNG